jgi:hypothetical protein
MNKIIIIVLCVTLPFFVKGQAKQPKLHYESNFLSAHYEIGEKRATLQEVQLHLEKTSPAAYYAFRKARNQNIAGYVTMGVGLGAGFGGAAIKNNNGLKLVVLTGALVSLGTSLYFTIAGPVNLNKAKNTYNKQYGY